MKFKGVIMAGGKGTRLRPITYSIPKPLVPIAGKPCINYVLESFHRAGVESAIITTGYKFESLIKGVLESRIPSQRILFSVEKEPAGTAGGIKLVSDFLDQTSIVGSGDILSDFELRDLVNFHVKNKNKVSIALTTVEDPSQFGIVETEGGRITRFLEKPSKDETFSKLVNAGIYVIERDVLDLIPQNRSFDFGRDLFPALLESGVRMGGIEVPGTWVDTGRPSDLIKANQKMTEKYGKQGKSHAGKLIVGENLQIDHGATIHGPTFIGNNVKIGKGSAIQASSIYDFSTIGSSSQITNSVIMDGGYVGTSSIVDSSVIMNGTSVGDNCEIRKSVLPPGIRIEDGSRIFNVSLSPAYSQDD
ncbi:MAG: NDP-sugar synthase [Candidatus Thermoplasmatota archaeon]|nr:NDP-sugar synthase [Candidatus Thermoplasmatota archaeon]MCL5731439.1 NDP-sugar synthase [Candidatus Thermoplasmatota archaeon]